MDETTIERMSREWLEVWTNGDPRTLPLSDDFEHVSPYGRVAGREKYLEMTIPMSKQNVMTIEIEDVIASGNQSAIRYTVRKPTGEVMHACDWLRFKGSKLTNVWAYYERPR